MTFIVSLTKVFVFLSRYAMFNILLSIVFFAWLFRRRVSLLEAHMCCRLVSPAGTSVITEYVAVLGECYPAGRDSSLNFLVLVFACGAVSLSQVDVAFNVVWLSGVDIYWYVLFNHHLYYRHVHLLALNFTFVCLHLQHLLYFMRSASAYVCVVGRAKITLSILKPLVLHVSLRNMLSICASSWLIVVTRYA